MISKMDRDCNETLKCVLTVRSVKLSGMQTTLWHSKLFFGLQLGF